MVDNPNTMVDLPSTMVDLPNTMVDLPDTMVDLPNTVVDIPNTMVFIQEFGTDCFCLVLLSSQNIAFIGDCQMRAGYRPTEMRPV